MKKQAKYFLNFTPLNTSSSRRQLLLSGLAFALLGGKAGAAQARSPAACCAAHTPNRPPSRRAPNGW